MFRNLFQKKRTYLDYAASAPASVRALHAHGEALQLVGNPSSPHTEGRAAKSLLEGARTRVARVLSVKSDDVIFTSGATEANNIAIQGNVMSAKRRGAAAPHVLYLPSAHASVIETLKSLSQWGVVMEPLAIRDGEIDIEYLKKQLRPDTVLVVVDMVCGETGTLWNTREVALALRDTSAKLLVDASQAPYTEQMERTRIAGDIIVLDAQKIGGVRGTGVLIAPRMLGLIPYAHGGGQERGLSPGTENVAGAVAFAIALEDAERERESRVTEWERMRNVVMDAIAAIPVIEINEGKKRSPRILNLSLRGRDTDYLVALLDEAGFAVSTKSACESDSSQGSRAVTALTQDEARATSTLRISWGPGVSMHDLTRFVIALKKTVVFLDASL
ncbi:MAG: aminotransferase class V-fold PLP-dependent enzyme [Candidatus Pacebacteria bacterium]|nr:aminotransferase class V-fold PLP-dependent enzyme [Candidatus Paceibacterota bacterium]MBP9840420.1 aminotransferase class V-fold PLP-dependent enzyme [Candidatus Paceibacterota bacterium]